MNKLDFSKGVVWGVIGAGNVCEKKSAPALNKIPGSSIKAVMRRNADAARDFANRHGIKVWFDDVDQLLADTDINAVYIATPPNSHKELTIKAAKANKAVYVEKPMANSWNDCREMIKACEFYDVPLFVAYYRRSLATFEKVKDIIQDDIIGKVREVNIELSKTISHTSIEDQWRFKNEIATGGLFYDLASHQIDLMNYFFGRILSIKGTHQTGIKNGQYLSECTKIQFECQNEISGKGLWQFDSNLIEPKDICRIQGSEGMIEFSTFSDMSVKFDSSKYGQHSFQFDRPQHIQQAFLEKVILALKEPHQFQSNAIEAAHANWVMEQVVSI